MSTETILHVLIMLLLMYLYFTFDFQFPTFDFNLMKDQPGS